MAMKCTNVGNLTLEWIKTIIGINVGSGNMHVLNFSYDRWTLVLQEKLHCMLKALSGPLEPLALLLTTETNIGQQVMGKYKQSQKGQW